jgi:tetratricopeptide (TPR) repeat protein
MIVAFGDHAQNEAVCREAIAVARSCGDDVVLGISLTNAAELALRRGEYHEARAFARESAEVLERTGDDFNRAGALANGASAALELGDLDAAAAGYAEALVLARALQAAQVIAPWAFDGLAAVAVRRGEADRAARLTGAADALLAESGVSRGGAFEERLRERTLADARAALGADALAGELDRGGSLTADEAAEYALAVAKRASAS